MNGAVRHVFVVNPAAGRESAAGDLLRRLRALDPDRAWDVYITKYPGEGTAFVREKAAAADGDIRFYACGGDGTLHEVINGAAGFPHVSVAAWPSGSGNDYVKYFGNPQRFMDLVALMAAPDRKVDLMQVNGDRYAINMVHFGLDSAVAETMVRVRRWPLLGGRNAYLAGAARAIVTSVRNAGQVYVDGEQLNEKELLLCNIACGRYVGGGFMSSPYSRNNDGLLDVLLVKPMPRLRIPGLIGLYKAGRHLESQQLVNNLVYRQGRQIRVISAPQGTQLLDGEIVHIPDMTVQVKPSALRFAVPEGR